MSDQWVENVCEYGDCPLASRRSDIERRLWHPENSGPIFCDTHRTLMENGGHFPPKPKFPPKLPMVREATVAPDVQHRCNYGVCSLLQVDTCAWCGKRVCEMHRRSPLAAAPKVIACATCAHKVTVETLRVPRQRHE